MFAMKQFFFPRGTRVISYGVNLFRTSLVEQYSLNACQKVRHASRVYRTSFYQRIVFIEDPVLLSACLFHWPDDDDADKSAPDTVTPFDGLVSSREKRVRERCCFSSVCFSWFNFCNYFNYKISTRLLPTYFTFWNTRIVCNIPQVALVCELFLATQKYYK